MFVPADVLRRLSEIINSGQSLNSVLSDVSSLIRRYLSADSTSILLLDADHENLLFRGASGLDQWEKEHIFFELGEGVAGTVAETGESLLIRDTDTEERFKEFSGQNSALKSMICVPLKTEDQLLGVLCADRTDDREPFSDSDLQKLETVAAQVSLAIENHRLSEMTIRDELTGLYNRRYFERRFSEEIARAARHDLDLSLAMLDIDDFKEINDQYGHPAGDLILREMGDLIQETVRTSDIACRYGGEEIAVIFVETNVSEGIKVVRRLLSRVRNKKFHVGSRTLEVTFSAGISDLADRGESEIDVLQKADQNLYKAKQTGKDKCVPPHPGQRASNKASRVHSRS